MEELRGKRSPSLRRAELGNFCSRLGLNNTGTRATLLSRRSQAVRSHTPPATSTTGTSLTAVSQNTVTTTNAGLFSSRPVTVSSILRAPPPSIFSTSCPTPFSRPSLLFSQCNCYCCSGTSINGDKQRHYTEPHAITKLSSSRPSLSRTNRILSDGWL